MPWLPGRLEQPPRRPADFHHYPKIYLRKNSKLIYLAATALEVFSNWARYKLTYSFIHYSPWVAFGCCNSCVGSEANRERNDDDSSKLISSTSAPAQQNDDLTHRSFAYATNRPTVKLNNLLLTITMLTRLSNLAQG